jgi:hypothetical protein
MEEGFLPELSGDGIIRKRVLSPEELEAIQKQERDREIARREASISARLKFVLQEDSSVVKKSESPIRENI